ncbi:MAG: hypothetical protein QXS69_03150 [Candidatus Aenigmatarchaeota archaeon]
MVKLFTAVEIVFMIFIFIVAVLVIVQLFTKYVSSKKINSYYPQYPREINNQQFREITKF